MNIIFVSNVCDRDEYENIFNQRKKKMIDPMQKFLEQIISGISKNVKNVISISVRPISHSTMVQKRFSKKNKQLDNINYRYPAFINGKFLRFFTQFFSTYIETKHIVKNNKYTKNNTVIICDALCLQACMAARLAGKSYGIKSIAIVTDIPSMATKMKSEYSRIRRLFQSLYESITMCEIKKYDGYINLVKEMDALINPFQKPSIVVEGTVEEVNNIHRTTISDKKVVLYAGGINKSYGLENLVKGFIQCNRSDAELHIYGDGAYANELKEICAINPYVKYMGVALNSHMVQIESQASLLVNPRFSHEEYTFYSFPSKILEYMSSGTPVCTTRLRGIPGDYETHLYWFNDESIDGIANTLSSILDKDEDELKNFGQDAKQFVCKNKNKVVQGKKIVEFCAQILAYK